jgi:hypothetical protein
MDRQRRPSVHGLYIQIQVVVRNAFGCPRGWLDVGLERLQDRVLAGAGPGGERWAEVLVVEVFCGDHQALPFGQPIGESAVLYGRVLDPLVELRDLLPAVRVSSSRWAWVSGSGSAERRPEAAELTMIIRWCMGVTRKAIMAPG